MSFENVKTFSNDSSLGKVACRAGDDVAKEKAADNAARFHDWPAKSLHEQDHDEHRESETNVLGTSPGKGMRSSDIWAFGEEIQTCIRDIAGARSITTSPVLKTRADRRYTNEHNSWASNNGWEELLQNFWWEERSSAIKLPEIY